MASRKKLRILVALGALSLTLVATAATAPLAPAAGTCVTKPDVEPLVNLVKGTTGTAYTVVEDRTIVTFDVEVLGVLPDGIGPGIPFVLVKTSGPVIDATGGIAAGMSGSPVYVGGKLAGSISYGMFGADQTIGGMTPAQNIIDIMDYPESSAAPFVKLTTPLRQTVAAATDRPLAAIPGHIEQLRVPVSVSGLTSRELGYFQTRIDRRGQPFELFKGASASIPSANPPVTNLDPGSSFAAVASYGDVTFAGIGTTTATCGNVAMAWGHPFYFTGKASLGMNAADITTVVTDPSSIWGPFKIGTIAETVGTVDQDRRTGIRGIYGQMPTLIPITAHLTNTDLAKTRDGETDVVWGDVLPDIAAFHTMSNIDTVFDRSGEGTTSLKWTVDGLRQDGSPFHFKYSNMLYSPWDASIESADVLYSQLSQMQHNGFEKIKFAGVNIQGSITQDELSAEITDVQSASPMMPAIRDRGTLRARPGQHITLRVGLHPLSGPDYTVDLDYKIPHWSHGSGPLTVTGGAPDAGNYGYYYGYYYGPGPSGSGPESFDDVLAQLSGGIRNNDIVVQLFPRRGVAQDQREYSQSNLIHGGWVLRLQVVR